MVTTKKELEDRALKIKETIVRLLFEDKKPIVTEVTICKEVSCYQVNIRAVVKTINDSALYPYINCVINSYGVLTLVV